MSKIPALESYLRWVKRSIDDATSDMSAAEEAEYLRRRLSAEILKVGRIQWREPRTESPPKEGDKP